jgi:pyruvate formate lyase activating enzyme
MKIMGLEKMTLLDYPGKVACTVFLAGCNFRCPFCHNPRLVFGKDLPAAVETADFFEFLSRRIGLLDGVCITGGEPLLQPEIVEFISRIQQMGFDVKLDTNGSRPETLAYLLDHELIDYVAMDIKNSREHYGKTIGVPDYDIQPIEHSVQLLKGCAVPYEFRTTVVREFHSVEDMLGIGRWISGADTYVLQSFVQSDELLSHENMSACSQQQLSEFKHLLTDMVEQVYIRE